SFTDYPFFFLLRGRVDPGWICSILTRARSIFVMMPSTVAVQMKGFGFSFQLRRNSPIACFRSGTLTKLARLIALSLNSLNQRLNLTLFIQTQYQRLLRRVQIQPHYISQLLQEFPIPRQLEGAAQVRFEIVQLPQAVHRTRADLLRLRHESAAPMGHPRGLT